MTNNNLNHDFLFSEAPARWNTRYVDPNCFECQFTLRALFLQPQQLSLEEGKP